MGAATWQGTTDVWALDSNWTVPPTYPQKAGDVAIFSTASPLNQPSVKAETITIGSIQFSPDVGTTILESGGGLIFEGSSASISVSSTGNIIAAPITLSSNLSITFSSSSADLTLSKEISGSAKSLTMSGAGTLSLQNSGTKNSYGNMVINSGTVLVQENTLGSGSVSLLGGTFKLSGQVLSAQAFALSNNAVFDTNGHILSLSGIISGDVLTQTDAGSGTLKLLNTNKYTGGTIVKGGVLEISQDGNLGDASGSLALEGGTLRATSSFSLGAARFVSLTGNPTIALSGSGIRFTIPGNITGTGSLTVSGTGNTLHLKGESSYSGPTSVVGATLEGDTSSLKGVINVSSPEGTVVFNQASEGTYAGSFSGTSETSLNLTGGGTYTFSGDSSSSSSSVTLSNAHLVLTGQLGSSSFTVDANSSLEGTGTLSSPVTASGQIIPGIDGEGTLTVNGDVTFGTLRSEVDPLTNGLLQVNGTANLNNGPLIISPADAGFYGLTKEYTLLNATTRSGTFAPPTVTIPRFVPTVSYTSTSVLLTLLNKTPFLGFDFSNSNEKAVGENLDALSLQNLLSPDLTFVINSLTNQSTSAVNKALDQMHPAALGAFAELQMNLGGQFLSTLSRATSFCGCSQPNRFWVEPFGNWLDVDTRDKNLGFDVTTKGVAVGYDREFFGFWTVGLGGAYNSSDLGWSLDRGYAYLKGAYGALYTDLVMGNFALEGSVYVGKDWYDTMRHIRFTAIDRQATSHSSGLDIGSRLNLAYYFGTSSFLLYPYLEIDYLYLKNSSFTETGAMSLSLDVDEYTNSTLRGQTGIMLRFADRNRDDTICISPLLSMGYLVEAPLYRSSYKARFSGEPISFHTQGWDTVWHLLNLRLGLGITYRCFSLDSLYIADLSPDGGSPYTNQRANFRFSYRF